MRRNVMLFSPAPGHARRAGSKLKKSPPRLYDLEKERARRRPKENVTGTEVALLTGSGEGR